MQLTRRLHLLHPAHALLAAAWASAMALGCSSDHLIGDLSQPDLSNEDDANSTAGGQDFLVSSVLGPPDVTFGNDTSFLASYAVSLGDLDGDGLGEFATRNWDVETGVSYVHIRYGVPRPDDLIQAFAWTEGGARLTVAEGLRDIAVVPLGDVDADGYPDLLVALVGCATTEGAFLVYGSPARFDGVRAIAEAGVFLQAPQVDGPRGCGDDLGPFAAALGDFDGDGFDDFVLTNPPQWDLRNAPEIGPRYPGGAYLFYGRAERLANGTSWLSADVRLHAPQTLNLNAIGDVNADGLGDLILGADDIDFPPGYEGPVEPGAFYWLPGRATRLSGDVDLPTLGTSTALGEARALGDLDGDGVNEVLLDAEGGRHLFYGAPALFDSGVDTSLASATFDPYPGDDFVHLVSSNDRDGDGDDELISVQLLGPRQFIGDVPQLLALISGSAARLSGNVALPEPGNPHSSEGTPRFVESIFPVGDLDGDGADDLLTRSNEYPTVDEDGRYRHLEDDAWQRAQLHIHYGIPGEVPVPLR